MTRYFLAFPFPEEIRHQLLTVRPPADAVSRVLDGNELHLTLHFLGPLDQTQVARACSALNELRHSAINLGFRGVGQFPPEGAARVLWAGVAFDDDLLQLHRELGEALKSGIGYQPEKRPYTPHVTLARCDGVTSSSLGEQFLERFRDFAIPRSTFTKYCLFSSETKEGKPYYRVVAEFSLG